MSDLSSPPLSLVRPAAPASPGGGEPFAWPTPMLPCYPAPVPLRNTEPCELEGLNGAAMRGRLVAFDPAGGALQLHPSGAQSPVTVRFDQFRRLRLAAPLAPLPSNPGECLDAALTERPMLPYTVHMKGQQHAMHGLTVRHVEAEYGIFLFEPLDKVGSVRRVFVPRAAYERADVGARIGETLVDEQLTTPGALDDALAEQEQLRSRKLGDILLARQVISQGELVEAIEQQSKMPMVRIGEALIAMGMITTQQLDEALAQQRVDRGLPLGELLVRRGSVTREDLQLALSRKMGFPLVDVERYPPDADAVSRLPFAVARRVPALPLLRRGGRLVVAMEDPTRKAALDEVEFAAQCKIVPVLARLGTLGTAIDRAYEKTGAATGGPAVNSGGALEFEAEDASKLLATLEQQQTSEIVEGADDKAIEQSDNSLVRLINSIILEAQAQRVSDIHIECQPGRDKVRVRFRKDGQMRPYMELPHTYRSALIARLKIMCDLDISERRKPQDGKITFGKFVPGQRLELRVATLPTFGGMEDAVLRLLASAKPIPLDNLGLAPQNLRWLKDAMQRPYGMILCVGPTGSGKTTTLHSALGFVNTPERKIWTAEDPIEITQVGLRQVQVNPKIEWTFAKALRAFLRADPDVIMVGEIRDEETARIAVEASLTGHLVLSTLHTNSAAETVTRLVDMGMDPFNFADSLLVVLAQRLVRRICTACRQPLESSAEAIEELLADYQATYHDAAARPRAEEVLAGWTERFGSHGRLTLYRGVGCAQCDHSGLQGRAGLHELLPASRELRRLIQTRARADEIHQAALGEGMRTLRQDGIDKVLAGITTIEEVRANSY